MAVEIVPGRACNWYLLSCKTRADQLHLSKYSAPRKAPTSFTYKGSPGSVLEVRWPEAMDRIPPPKDEGSGRPLSPRPPSALHREVLPSIDIVSFCHSDCHNDRQMDTDSSPQAVPEIRSSRPRPEATQRTSFTESFYTPAQGSPSSESPSFTTSPRSYRRSLPFQASENSTPSFGYPSLALTRRDRSWDVFSPRPLELSRPSNGTTYQGRGLLDRHERTTSSATYSDDLDPNSSASPSTVMPEDESPSYAAPTSFWNHGRNHEVLPGQPRPVDTNGHANQSFESYRRGRANEEDWYNDEPVSTRNNGLGEREHYETPFHRSAPRIPGAQTPFLEDSRYENATTRRHRYGSSSNPRYNGIAAPAAPSSPRGYPHSPYHVPLERTPNGRFTNGHARPALPAQPLGPQPYLHRNGADERLPSIERPPYHRGNGVQEQMPSSGRAHEYLRSREEIPPSWQRQYRYSNTERPAPYDPELDSFPPPGSLAELEWRRNQRSHELAQRQHDAALRQLIYENRRVRDAQRRSAERSSHRRRSYRPYSTNGSSRHSSCENEHMCKDSQGKSHQSRVHDFDNSLASEYTTSQHNRRRRGNLPRWITDILRTWFNDHLNHPYPGDEEKARLMELTGLSIQQVCQGLPYYDLIGLRN